MKGTPINFFNDFPIEFFGSNRGFTICPEQVNLREPTYGRDQKYLEVSGFIDNTRCELLSFNQGAVPTFTHLLLDNEYYRIERLFHNEWITEIKSEDRQWMPTGKTYFHLSWDVMPMSAIRTKKSHWKLVGF